MNIFIGDNNALRWKRSESVVLPSIVFPHGLRTTTDFALLMLIFQRGLFIPLFMLTRHTLDKRDGYRDTLAVVKAWPMIFESYLLVALGACQLSERLHI